MRTPAAVVLALHIVAVAAGPSWAQVVDEAEAQFDNDELDALVAPVALFPDSLLTQVMVASTFPLDVMKADRFVDDSADLDVEARADAVEAEDWDPSIQVLASGFPTVINRMADEIDWTEQLGDAVLVQTDDVLDAVQRMRAQAAATGYLASNDAQVVDIEDEAISIAPADPDVVYVPSYDPAMAFSAAPTAAPVIVSDPGLSTTDLVTTGAIAFGSAFLINELFDDDDDDDWNNYWRGPSNIDWDDGDFNPRPDINVDGDVNINRGRFTNVDRDEVTIDRDRIGSLDPDALQKDRERGWKPSEDRKNAARDKIATAKRNDRPAAGDRPDRPGAGDLPNRPGAGERPDRPALGDQPNRPGAGGGVDSDRANAARDKLRAGSGDGAGDARAKLQKASAERRPTAAAHRPETALKPKPASSSDVRKAKDRAVSSGKAPQVRKATASRPTPAVKKPAVKPKTVSRPQAAKRPAAKRPQPKPSAFKKSGGARPKAASARGKSSKSKRR